MLLRRITQHVKNQNWFAVFLDFVIVVVGVFIGIQVSNWNDSRLENLLSEDFSNRLRKDLAEEAWDYQYIIEYYTDVKQNVEQALNVLELKKDKSDLDFLIAAYRATQYNIFTRKRSTYDELESTGRIYLIKDQLLRDTAISVYNFPIYETITARGEKSKYRELFRMNIPSHVQIELAQHCGDRNVAPLDYEAIVDSIDYPCHPELSDDDIKESAEILKNNPDFLAFLRLRMSELNSNLKTLEYYFPEISENLKKFRVE